MISINFSVKFKLKEVTIHNARTSFKQIQYMYNMLSKWSWILTKIESCCRFKEEHVNKTEGEVSWRCYIQQVQEGQRIAFYPVPTTFYFFSLSWPLSEPCDGPHNYLQLSSLPPHQLQPLLIQDPQAVSLIYTQPQPMESGGSRIGPNNGTLVHYHSPAFHSIYVMPSRT